MAIPPIRIQAFGGEFPRIDTRLLEDRLASDCVNAWLFSGRIEPIHALTPLHVMADPLARSWLRVPKGNPGVDNMLDSYWVEFQNENVRVIRSPVSGQDDPRFYWADGVQPQMLTFDMIKDAAEAVPPVSPVPWKLGVPAPSTAPTVVVTGGVSTTIKTVTYVYTWVTGFGEEGPPSPPTTVDGKIDATYTIGLTEPTTAEAADRNITHWRIYRSVVSAQGVAVFFFVAEGLISIDTYIDDCAVFPDSVIVANEQLASALWSAPPDDLKGMVTMANGMVAGWRANEVWFCEPYRPHAWPITHTIAVDAEVVGLGVHNQSVAILTTGQPYIATGVFPEAMSLAKIQPLEPCTSMRSIVNTPKGVLYCSPNGLINITAAGAQNLTEDLILKDQWTQRLNLYSLMATTVTDDYYCYAGPTSGVFQKDAFQHFVDEVDPVPDTEEAFQTDSHFGMRPGMYIPVSEPQLGLTMLDPHPGEVFNLIMDLYNAETMMLRDGIIQLVDLRKTAPYAKYRWKSKIFTLPYLQNLGAAKVYWTPKDPAASADPSVFRVYAGEHAELIDDGLPLKFAQQMTKSGQMFRLPSGYKAQYYQFEVEGFVVVDAIHAAQTARELRQI